MSVHLKIKSSMGLLQADKHAITQQLGVQLRDLRLLDPNITSSGT